MSKKAMTWTSGPGDSIEQAHYYRNFGGRDLRKFHFLPFILETNDRLESSRFAEMNVNYGTFHVDPNPDLHIPTA
jgi:hypothetical protein